jgi:uncharacterized protein (TIGR02145 family)
MKKLFIFFLAGLCSNFALKAQSDSIFPEMKYRTWVMPYKTGHKQLLFELKDSSVMISNSARKRDYHTGDYTVSNLDVKKITEIRYEKSGRGYGIWIGGLSGLLAGVTADLIIYQDYKAHEAGEAVGNFFIMAFMPIATAGVGFMIGALIYGPKKTIEIHESQKKYNLNKAKMDDIVLYKDPSLQCSDIDGNSYNAVIYKGKAWMTENLRVTRYRNGDSIPEVKEDSAWKNTRGGARCWYNNNPRPNKKQGLLYNWNAVADKRGLCPDGWHVTTNEEWSELISCVSGTDTSMTSASDTLSIDYASRNLFLNPEYSFSVPNGYRDITRNFYTFRFNAQFWTSISVDPDLSKALFLRKRDKRIFFADTDKNTGLSVRCVRDRK